ncbi:hypothetical protein FQA39_LY07844 [Lamprigera yunnana]|nr:hypothetical protein FQA39_LY07844 [Lamprigera yunnana]
MVLTMDQWQGKVAIVTGASAGCGEAIATALVDSGMQVVGLARREEKLNELSRRLNKSGKSGKFHPVKCDITNENDIKNAFQWVKNNLKEVHVLVNNAGIGKPLGLLSGKPSDWLDILKTNVLGLSIATQQAVNDMIQKKNDGHVIHISSVLGHYVARVPNSNMYPASKFAVTALTETLRQELNQIGSKIKITSISPGPVDSEFQKATTATSNEEWEQFFTQLPKLQPEDVADAVIYVLSTPPHVQVQELMIRPLGEPV